MCLPAQVFKINNRGIIKENAFADLVIFNIDKIKDKATFTEPYQLAEGVEFVFINGKAAIFEGQSTAILNGKVVTK